MTGTPLSDLGVTIPVLAAPMAGGPTTPELVTAASRAGSLGFLAGGYLSPEALSVQIDAVRRQTQAFAVNLFAPNPLPVDRVAYNRYAALLQRDAEQFGVSLPEHPVEDDDGWRGKIDVLVDKPAPLVSFTFGIPESSVLDALHKAGSVLMQSVTSAEEARLASDAGVDLLAVQASAAGGHSATLTPSRIPPARPLPDVVAEIGKVTDLPMVAAGGVGEPSDVVSALQAGALAVMVGTALLLAPESGTSAAHRDALADPRPRDTVVTRAFTGRPARGLRNTFTDSYDDRAPLGYPALHHLTRPIRRAAVAAGDPEYVNLWAGTGYRAASQEPAGQILTRLAGAL